MLAFAVPAHALSQNISAKTTEGTNLPTPADTSASISPYDDLDKAFGLQSNLLKAQALGLADITNQGSRRVLPARNTTRYSQSAILIDLD